MEGHYYHVYNKSIGDFELFADESVQESFLKILQYYTLLPPQLSYSIVKKLDDTHYTDQLEQQFHEADKTRISIFAYCIMPDHYHILLKERERGTISKFMNDVLNSFTRNYNFRFHRKGPLFLPVFKRKMIFHEKTFLHVMRYIHLNPFSAGLISDIRQLEYYTASSHREYMQPTTDLIFDKVTVMQFFNNDVTQYQDFIYEQAGYQKSLQLLKYLS